MKFVWLIYDVEIWPFLLIHVLNIHSITLQLNGDIGCNSRLLNHRQTKLPFADHHHHHHHSIVANGHITNANISEIQLHHHQRHHEYLIQAATSLTDRNNKNNISECDEDSSSVFCQDGISFIPLQDWTRQGNFLLAKKGNETIKGLFENLYSKFYKAWSTRTSTFSRQILDFVKLNFILEGYVICKQTCLRCEFDWLNGYV